MNEKNDSGAAIESTPLLAEAYAALSWIAERGSGSGVIPCPRDYAHYIIPMQERAKEMVDKIEAANKLYTEVRKNKQEGDKMSEIVNCKCGGEAQLCGTPGYYVVRCRLCQETADTFQPNCPAGRAKAIKLWNQRMQSKAINQTIQTNKSPTEEGEGRYE